MHIIIVDLLLAIFSFLSGLVVLYAWFFLMAHAALDDKGRRRTKFRVAVPGLLISVPFFGLGLHNLLQLTERQFPSLPALLVQSMILGLFVWGALAILFIFRRQARVDALVESGRTDEAVELVESWIGSAKKPNVNLHTMLGMIYLNTQRPEQAAAQFRRAMEISPQDPTHLCNLAVALNNLGETDEALELLDRAEQKSPAMRDVYAHNRCFFLAQAGRIDEARTLLPQVERYHQQQMTQLPPLQQRQLMETLSKIHALCGMPPAPDPDATAEA